MGNYFGNIVGLAAGANEIHPAADLRAVSRQLCRALLKHGDGRPIDGDNASYKKNIGHRMWRFVVGNANYKPLLRSMFVRKFVYKIKSKWKRYAKTATDIAFSS